MNKVLLQRPNFSKIHRADFKYLLSLSSSNDLLP